ncbi:MAG: cation:proton antiporter [Cytophagales bacterium]|nr:cation:proton antiporter [Cytophagales bacterium]MDW8383157.1 cation:proton antiporter [Flammeovirgaceae bacterium]
MIFLMELTLLSDLIIVLGISVFVILLLHRLQIPTIIGFLISGVICGPHTLNLIKSESQVDILAEIGVVLLLFTIGLEFSIASLMRVKKAVLQGGSLQVLITLVIFGMLSYYLSYDYLPIAIFLGCMFALSSTAIVLKVMQMSGDVKKEFGQITLAILIFQDIAVVPMMLAIPILAGENVDLWNDLLFLALKVSVIILFLIVSIKYVVPKLLYYIADTRSKDLFIVAIVVICFAIAWLTAQAGLSLALGAFLAGLVISESKYGYEAAGIILPFKEIFTSIFFVSVGMLIDVSFLLEHFFEIIFITFLVMTVKAMIGGFAAKTLGINTYEAILVGFSICQIGEFSFVLMKSGVDYGVLPIELNQYFLSIAVLTMAITPLLINKQHTAANWLINILPVSKKIKKRLKGLPTTSDAHNVKQDTLNQHIVIIGFGMTGKSVAHAAQSCKIPYVVIELDPHIVEVESKHGIPIIYGDADNEEVLHHARAHRAKCIVITTSANSEKTEVLAYRLKKYSPDSTIIARTQRNKDADSIKRHGADIVIADDVEANLEVLMEVMDLYDISAHEVYSFASYIRKLSGS